MTSRRRRVLLFDVDGTLTPARKSATQEMKDLLLELQKDYVVAVVGGSDLAKQKEQLGDDVTDVFDFSFSENGLVAYGGGKLIHEHSIVDHLGEARICELLNYALMYISKIDLPFKRGTFIEFRTGMINASPCGRSVSYPERLRFVEYEKTHPVRMAMVADFEKRFSLEKGWDIKFSIGGQISVDIFPRGWDKTYCLQFLSAEEFDEIHFFGDKTMEGGNDFEIFEHPRTIGHAVSQPEDTMKILRSEFLKK